jgi:hypothetical protein
MAAQGFLVRLQTPQGMKRHAFASDAEKFGALQAIVQQELGVAPKDQQISKPPSKQVSQLMFFIAPHYNQHNYRFFNIHHA